MLTDPKVAAFVEAVQLESPKYGVRLPAEAVPRLANYYQLLNEWNPSLHLVAPCPPSEFATRHVLESLFLLKHLSLSASIADVGSGAGLPAIPCVIVRRDLRATLIESSKRKSVFLTEVAKRTNIVGSIKVVAERFEDVAGIEASYVTCRALDRFEDKLEELIAWSPPSRTLLLYGGNSLRSRLRRLNSKFEEELLPNSDRRFLFTVFRG